MQPGAPFSNENVYFERCEEFIYLGSMMTSDNNPSKEIGRRAINHASKLLLLSGYFRSRLFKKNTKLILYKTFLRPVLTNASETRALSKREKRALLIFERKILRRIFGPICVDVTREDIGTERMRDSNMIQILCDVNFPYTFLEGTLQGCV
ncbi:unnamed protein product [Leptosia nina]|uniref:Maturase K n=1 Tax=Leptosia nina TaxID=320188 RepID=A0AAV1JF23_9NEOP